MLTGSHNLELKWIVIPWNAKDCFRRWIFSVNLNSLIHHYCSIVFVYLFKIHTYALIKTNPFWGQIWERSSRHPMILSYSHSEIKLSNTSWPSSNCVYMQNSKIARCPNPKTSPFFFQKWTLHITACAKKLIWAISGKIWCYALRMHILLG